MDCEDKPISFYDNAHMCLSSTDGRLMLQGYQEGKRTVVFLSRKKAKKIRKWLKQYLEATK